jgi:hypothetical protein
MIREERSQPVSNLAPRLMGCDGKGNFHGIHVFMPPLSRAYVKNQSYTSGIPRMKKMFTITELNDTCGYTKNNPASTFSMHPAIAKAWVTFSGISGEVYEGFNILSVHKKSIGSYFISFIIPMRNTTYVSIVMAEGFNVQAAPTSLKTHGLEVETKTFGPNTKLSAYDSYTVHLVVFGSLHPSYLQ